MLHKGVVTRSSAQIKPAPTLNLLTKAIESEREGNVKLLENVFFFLRTITKNVSKKNKLNEVIQVG